MRSFYLRNMNITALLLSIGLVFHAVVPPIFFGMKPDFILSFMFIAFLLNAKYTNAFLIGFAGGILSGLTTSLPGGFLPNVIDKIITMNVVFVLYTVLNSIFKNIIKARFDQNFIIAPILSLIGTIISGTVFLLSAITLEALSISQFNFLFITMVLPATIGNIAIIAVVYYALTLAMKRSNIVITEV